jgi:hypothetical protein
VIQQHACRKRELYLQRRPLLGNGSENEPLDRQWVSSCHMLSSTVTHATEDDLLEAVFPVLPVPRTAYHCDSGFGRQLKDRKLVVGWPPACENVVNVGRGYRAGH